MTEQASVKETCRCGAVLNYVGRLPREAAREFRADHRICREARWPWTTPDAPVTRDAKERA